MTKTLIKGRVTFSPRLSDIFAPMGRLGASTIALLFVALAGLAACADSHCHCEFTTKCEEFAQACETDTSQISCNQGPGMSGTCPSHADVVGICDDSGAEVKTYYYATGYSTASAMNECIGTFTPAP